MEATGEIWLIGQEEIRMDIGGCTQTGRMSIQISGTAQTQDWGTPFLMAGKLQQTDHRLRIPC